MPEVTPFRALRYAKDPLGDVIAPPYDVVSPAERKVLAARSPHNVVHVDLPEGDGDARYDNAARILAAWRKDQVLVKDEKPCLLAYEQTFAVPASHGGGTRTRRGFLCLVRLEPFGRGVLAHERTLSGPKVDRTKLFHATKTSLSPVFFLYRDPAGTAWSAAGGGERVDSFTTSDGVKHALRRVADPEALRTACAALSAHPILVADGHHRYETALAYAGIAEGDEPSDRSPKRYALAFLSNRDDPGLVVYATHRLIVSTGRADRPALLRALEPDFEARSVTGDADALLKELAAAGRVGPAVVAVWPDGSADVLTLKGEPAVLKQRPEVMRRLDVVVLHDAILEAHLGIDAAALAAQTFVRYPKDAAAAVADVRGRGGEVLFLMNPTPVDDVARVCEAGEFMPQKSTFFYPKVPTGLAFHPLDDPDPVPDA